MKPIFSKTGITLDLLVLLIIVPAHVDGRDAYIAVVALLAYLLLALWYPIPETRAELRQDRRGWLAFNGRYALILLIAVGVVFVPTLNNVLERAETQIQSDGYSPAYQTLSDSAMQTELAISYLADGLNPYEQSYSDTPLRFYQWLDVGNLDWEDPAYEHFVYLPGNLLLSLPFYESAELAGVLYDQRIVFLFFYLVLLLVLPHMIDSTVIALTLLVCVGLNPLLTKGITLGMNDIVVFLALVLTILSMTRRRFLLAALFLGLACALKQYAWLIVPFFLFFVWQQTPHQQRLKQVTIAASVVCGVAILVILPFFLWNPQAFYVDVLAFPAGRVENLYPIRGYTIGRLLMGAGIIPTFVSPFPFQLLQIFVCLPLLLLLLRYQSKRDLGSMLLASAVFIFVFSILSRFFHENYIGIIIALATIGILLTLSITTQSTNKPIPSTWDQNKDR
jgi:hypothetical protein